MPDPEQETSPPVDAGGETLPGAALGPRPGLRLGRFRLLSELGRGGMGVVYSAEHLDTGAVYGGELTAWIAEEDRLVSVPARRSYTPTGI